MGKTTNFDLEKAAEQRKAEMKDITEKLEKGVQDVFSSEQFQNLLDTMAKFPHYSVNNNILIMMQKPDSFSCDFCHSYSFLSVFSLSLTIAIPSATPRM